MKKSLIAKLVFDAIGAFSGLLSMIFAFCIFFMNTGYFESSARYGGDAYTGIQNAAAQTANNVQDLCEIAQIGFGGILLIAGIILISHYTKMIINTLITEKSSTQKIDEPTIEAPVQINDDSTIEVSVQVNDEPATSEQENQ